MSVGCAQSAVDSQKTAYCILPTKWWRKGWDSNPRNPLRLTAFPMLPIQPLLHLSENWRRGWDSNPRYPLRYNNFRDCPIQPLSHLSARTYDDTRSAKPNSSGGGIVFLTPLLKKGLQNSCTFPSKNAGSNLDPVIERVTCADPEMCDRCTEALVKGSEDEP